MKTVTRFSDVVFEQKLNRIHNIDFEHAVQKIVNRQMKRYERLGINKLWFDGRNGSIISCFTQQGAYIFQ